MLVKRAVWLAVTGVSLYLLAPSLMAVLSSTPRLREIEPAWLGVMVALQVASFACQWWLQKVAMHTHDLFAVITSQLAGNAFGRIVPGGAAAAGALQFRMLMQAGLDAGAAAAGLAAAAVLTFAALLALLVFCVPALLGTQPVDRGLARAAWAGLALFVALAAAGVTVMALDRPLQLVARLVAKASGRSREAVETRLLGERDRLLEALGDGWWQAVLASVGKWGLDYATLLAALTAVGANPTPSLILLAYCIAQLLGQIPITPGGLGFVEAGLTATLALARVSPANAVLATLAYRLVSYWLPLPVGLVASVLHRRRYGHRPAPEPAS
jgi:putative heme transporter